MAADGHATPAQLQRWRTQGHDRIDPVHFAFLEALQQRAHAHDGALRRVLDARMQVLLDAYAARIESQPATADATARPAVTLSDLPAPRNADYPQLPALAEFRSMWASLRTESQVRQTLAQEAPSDSGPLNSSMLVHRTLGWMGEVSPGYLQHFLAYVDNLAWLDTLQQRGTLPSRDSAAPGAKPRRRTAR
ncbi:DUF2894 domain-containing protein [Stenotrophomonas oahuensis]|uniref:DUF2894 domain-containing protein n=1 Tax=Stenotrophomonas oahuensis TaxID=3003271 RepID=A0ABY9YNI3_9GAMM|nr:DUF2894 domain-containing protein [Stenotrophomonas sp. A5586]WNH52278.1 DUF2894 domain-containing protein [Stenotrophomonas sp. A5586]